MNQSKTLSLIRVLAARVDTILCELALCNDAERDHILQTSDVLDKIQKAKSALNASGGCESQEHMKLLQSKKKVMMDIVSIIDALEKATCEPISSAQ